LNIDIVMFSQSIHSIRFHRRLSTDTRWVVCLYKWPLTLHSCGWSLYEWQTTRKLKLGLVLVRTRVYVNVDLVIGFKSIDWFLRCHRGIVNMIDRCGECIEFWSTTGKRPQ